MRSVRIFIFIVLVVVSVTGYAQQERFSYNDHGKRDPLWPLISSKGSTLSYDTDFLVTDLSLEGIMVGSGGQNLAIINGRVLEQNQQIGQYTIISIATDTVTLKKDQQTFELKLKKEE